MRQLGPFNADKSINITTCVFSVHLHQFHEEFWTRMAGELRELVLRDVDISTDVLYSILTRCRRLESLELTGKRDIPADNIALRVRQDSSHIKYHSRVYNHHKLLSQYKTASLIE